MKTKLLVVDDEPFVLELIRRGFESDEVEVFCALRGQDAVAIFEEQHIDLAILDYSLPDLCGAELFHHLRAARPDLPVIFLTGYPNLGTAVTLMKEGARDYLTKPFSISQLRAHVDKLLQSCRIGSRRAPASPRSSTDGREAGGYIFGNSPAMRAVEAQIQNLPRHADVTVLITGPTGTGKSAVARRIHELTWGDRAPFVEIDCSTIPRELCESELFGHEKGSFTGAHRTKRGLFEAAGNGTAFLDEIGDLDLALQVKFLHVLEAKEFKRVGDHVARSMRARVVAATNRSLPELVRSGRFREDLFFRLNVFELWMPPLKERGEDILMLARHFLDRFAAHYGKPISGFTAEALNFLCQCDYPGNVRELRNMIERAVINCENALIDFAQLVALRRPAAPSVGEASVSLLPGAFVSPAPPAASAGSCSAIVPLAAIERQKLCEALAAAQGNKSQAAKLLGLSRTAFHRRLAKHNVESEGVS